MHRPTERSYRKTARNIIHYNLSCVVLCTGKQPETSSITTWAALFFVQENSQKHHPLQPELRCSLYRKTARNIIHYNLNCVVLCTGKQTETSSITTWAALSFVQENRQKHHPLQPELRCSLYRKTDRNIIHYNLSCVVLCTGKQTETSSITTWLVLLLCTGKQKHHPLQPGLCCCCVQENRRTRGNSSGLRLGNREGAG